MQFKTHEIQVHSVPLFPIGRVAHYSIWIQMPLCCMLNACILYTGAWYCHVTVDSHAGCWRLSLSFWSILLSGCEISSIDFEELRSCYLLSRSVGFAFCYHRGYFCIWTVLVGCFVTFSGLVWSTYNSREDRFQSTLPLTYLRRTMEQRRQIPVSTYDIQPKHDLCADISGVALDI